MFEKTDLAVDTLGIGKDKGAGEGAAPNGVGVFVVSGSTVADPKMLKVVPSTEVVPRDRGAKSGNVLVVGAPKGVGAFFVAMGGGNVADPMLLEVAPSPVNVLPKDNGAVTGTVWVVAPNGVGTFAVMGGGHASDPEWDIEVTAAGVGIVVPKARDAGAGAKLLTSPNDGDRTLPLVSSSFLFLVAFVG